MAGESGILYDIQKGIGALVATVELYESHNKERQEAHEARDQERHADVCKRLEKLEDNANRTGQHLAVNAAELETGKERRDVAVKTILMFAGAAIAGIGFLVAHVLGWK